MTETSFLSGFGFFGFFFFFFRGQRIFDMAANGSPSSAIVRRLVASAWGRLYMVL